MRKVKKSNGTIVIAYQLGANSDMEQKMIAEGKIKLKADGKYEIFSQEAVNGSGEIAEAGDYFKVDGSGAPYPNNRKWFEENHQYVAENQYLQNPKILDAWVAGDPIGKEMEYLLQTGKLIIHENDPEKYFEAYLWGATLTAAKDAVVIFYSVERDGEAITDVSFNFVARREFEQTYEFV